MLERLVANADPNDANRCAGTSAARRGGVALYENACLSLRASRVDVRKMLLSRGHECGSESREKRKSTAEVSAFRPPFLDAKT